MRSLIVIFCILCFSCQTTAPYKKTVDFIEVPKFMGTWYVIASRPTFLEEGARDATEVYHYNDKTKEIEVGFHFFDQEDPSDKTEIPQIASIYNEETNAHWKISPWWFPWDMDFLILFCDEEYDWTAIGVPNQDYLWIMSRTPERNDEKVQNIINYLKKSGYDVENLRMIEHSP